MTRGQDDKRTKTKGKENKRKRGKEDKTTRGQEDKGQDDKTTMKTIDMGEMKGKGER